MSDEEVIHQLEENTRMTREMHTALLGSPTFKQPGLIDRYEVTEKKVMKHEYIITKWGSAIAVLLFLVELFLVTKK